MSDFTSRPGDRYSWPASLAGTRTKGAGLAPGSPSGDHPIKQETSASAGLAAKLALIGLSLAIIMVAWTLRVYHLGTQSLWVDEGFSYDVARQGIRAIFAILPAEDRHPPLHYLLLWATMRVAGTSEFSLRFLSAGSAILAIPLTLTLGRRLGGRTVGFTAAALLAISPFHVWYSQEARMYALLATLSLASFYCWLRVVAGDRRWAWGYVLATMAALYTHYYAVFILPGEVVAALLLGKWHQHARRWLILVAISPIAFAPWLLDVWQQYQRAPHGYQPDQGLPATLAKIATTYVTGEYTALDPRLLALVAVLALLGVLPLTRPRELTGVTLAAWLLAAPLGAFLFSALAAVDIRATGQMYYIAGLPPFALLVAHGDRRNDGPPDADLARARPLCRRRPHRALPVRREGADRLANRSRAN